ncbi:MAG: threonine-phosphate decarboxylase [Acetivibrio sp.]
MIKLKEHFHGSDLEQIEASYGIKKEDIVSFAANVNPLGISSQLRETLVSHIDAITSYPDRDYTPLRKAIAEYIHADFEAILVGNGSTELISLFIQCLHPDKTLILGPTYSEYEREVSIENESGSCQYYALKEEQNFVLDVPDFLTHLSPNLDLVILCNPNNPTSSYISTSQMKQILTACKRNHTFVLVDETYVEFTEKIEEISSVSLTGTYDNLIVLRGISKFFAAPGLRLGYAVCNNPDLLFLIHEKKNPWTINSLAAIAGEIMFKDSHYIEETKALIFQERTRIVALLQEIPFLKVYPPSANFVLVRILKKEITAEDIFETAIKKGLMIRDCSTFPFLDERYFRFCFMKPEQNDSLLSVLKDL